LVETPLTHTSLGATTMGLAKPETVLRTTEIDQSKRTAISALLFSSLGLLCTPLFGGDPLARRLFVVGLAISLLANAGLLYVSSNEQRYRESYVLAYFLAAPLFNAAVMYYLGIFGPILVIFVLNLYSVCLGYTRRIALVTLGACIVPVLALGGPMALGVIADPGLISVTAGAGRSAQGVILVAFLAFLVLTYTQARSTRQVMVASLAERDDAVRRASHREALFLEARQDLENALRAGGLGRFTDQLLGPFKLGEVLGRGGMGEVYEAVNTETGEPAAVKMLLPEVLGQPSYVRRFMREVRIAASLDSPYVVRVLQVGDEKAPLPYLAMERLHGEDLAQILRRTRRLRPSKIIELVRQIGRGIAAASAAGIVHRDLKPQNIFLTTGNPGVWKILDFGVSTQMTVSGTLTGAETVGTPQYMAPEQAAGREVDGRTDLYALGAIAYRALTGHRPFKGSELGAVLMAVMTGMPSRPSSLVDAHSDVDLAMAIALAKDPEARYRDGEQLADALAAAFHGQLDPAYRARACRLLRELPYDDGM